MYINDKLTCYTKYFIDKADSKSHIKTNFKYNMDGSSCDDVSTIYYQTCGVS